MAIFPGGGKSTAINSPRHLTLRHARRVIAAAKASAPAATELAAAARATFTVAAVSAAVESASAEGASEEAIEEKTTDEEPATEELPDEEPPKPGEEKLHSYWAPGLDAGRIHRVTVAQTINANNGDPELPLTAEQTFYVDAPQFALPDASVHSVYPPAGYSEDSRILPHIVLTDPHLPWERRGSPGTPQDRNRVPWLVLFSFSQDELRLSPEDLGDGGIFKDTSTGTVKPVKQSSTMTVSLSVADLWKVANTVTPIDESLGPKSESPGASTWKDSRGDFIFVKPDLFTSLFSTFNKDGKRQTGANANVNQYKFLSHVRHINGAGMALAGVEDTAVFSLVLGNRAGPLLASESTTMTVHLVSIEGVEAMSLPIQPEARYVALCSLYSWNYTVLPPGRLGVNEGFKQLGRTLDVLRAPGEFIKPLRGGNRVQTRIASRLDDGYSLAKYRTHTGELTVALYRGPFTPTHVPQLNLTGCSNSGLDLQVLDKEVGIMDITYSVAWQVGRTIALGDEVFTAALGRLRSAIQTKALKAAKIAAVTSKAEWSHRSREDVLKHLPNLVRGLAAMNPGAGTDTGGDGDEDAAGDSATPTFEAGGPKRRWLRPKLTQRGMPSLSFTSKAIEGRYAAASLDVSSELAASAEGGVFDETNDALSPDWKLVLSWLVDRMFLVGVPAHYLIADPSHLPTERLRFFHIDTNWVDALLDGALSLGNHMGEDKDRVAIKNMLNSYIGRTPDHMEHTPQIPTYGFYLRSDLVTMFPDLRVEVLPKDGVDVGDAAGTPLLRHEIVADGVMLGLLDRLPGSPEFGHLIFTQPPHQKRFAAADTLMATQYIADIRRQYTVDQTKREKDKDRHVALEEVTCTPQTADSLFIWDSEAGSGKRDLRILRLPRLGERQLQILNDKMPKYKDGQGVEHPFFQDDTPTSALLAMQLSDPVYSLSIDLEKDGNTVSLQGLAPGGDGGEPQLRTLARLDPPTVHKFRDAEPSSDEDSDEGSDVGDGDSAVSFGPHENHEADAHTTMANLAPHVRRTVTVDEPTPPARMSTAAARSGDPANPPEYSISISSNHPSGAKLVRLSKGPNVPQDLVVSVRVKTRSPDDYYKLVELAIQIPLGPNGPGDKDNYLLGATPYDGPGCHVLTNLRFNVLTSFPTINDLPYMRLRLLPRSAKGWIDIRKVTEMSFMLGLVRVNEAKTFEVQAVAESWADYCRDGGDDPSQRETVNNKDTFITIRNPNFDP